MTISKSSLDAKVKALFDEKFTQYDTETVPDISDSRLTHGATGMLGEFSYLYVDMRRSSSLGTDHRRQTIARVFKAFHHCMVEIIKDRFGKVRSFDGDRVLGIFDGKRQTNNAVEAAMLMVGTVKDVLQPKIKTYYATEDFEVGIGVARSKSMVIKAGVGYDVNNRDLVSVGTAANLGAKLSDEAKTPARILICDDSFSYLFDDNRYTKGQSGSRVDMWSTQYVIFAGAPVTVHSTIYYRLPSQR